MLYSDSSASLSSDNDDEELYESLKPAALTEEMMRGKTVTIRANSDNKTQLDDIIEIEENNQAKPTVPANDEPILSAEVEEEIIISNNIEQKIVNQVEKPITKKKKKKKNKKSKDSVENIQIDSEKANNSIFEQKSAQRQLFNHSDSIGSLLQNIVKEVLPKYPAQADNVLGMSVCVKSNDHGHRFFLDNKYVYSKCLLYMNPAKQQEFDTFRETADHAKRRTTIGYQLYRYTRGHRMSAFEWGNHRSLLVEFIEYERVRKQCAEFVRLLEGTGRCRKSKLQPNKKQVVYDFTDGGRESAVLRDASLLLAPIEPYALDVDAYCRVFTVSDWVRSFETHTIQFDYRHFFNTLRYLRKAITTEMRRTLAEEPVKAPTVPLDDTDYHTKRSSLIISSLWYGSDGCRNVADFHAFWQIYNLLSSNKKLETDVNLPKMQKKGRIIAKLTPVNDDISLFYDFGSKQMKKKKKQNARITAELAEMKDDHLLFGDSDLKQKMKKQDARIAAHLAAIDAGLNVMKKKKKKKQKHVNEEQSPLTEIQLDVCGHGVANSSKEDDSKVINANDDPQVKLKAIEDDGVKRDVAETNYQLGLFHTGLEKGDDDVETYIPCVVSTDLTPLQLESINVTTPKHLTNFMGNDCLKERASCVVSETIADKQVVDSNAENVLEKVEIDKSFSGTNENDTNDVKPYDEEEVTDEISNTTYDEWHSDQLEAIGDEDWIRSAHEVLMLLPNDMDVEESVRLPSSTAYWKRILITIGSVTAIVLWMRKMHDRSAPTASFLPSDFNRLDFDRLVAVII